MAARVNSVHVVLQGIVVVALLVVGVYGIVWTQTSPSDQARVINAILGGENNMLATGVTNGGDIIKPGVGFQYILMFKAASVAYYQAPSGYTLPTGGWVFSPLAWTPPKDTAHRMTEGMLCSLTRSASYRDLLAAAHSGLAVQTGTYPNPS